MRKQKEQTDKIKRVGRKWEVKDITGRKRMEDVLTIRNRIADIFLTVPDDDMYTEVLKVMLEVMQSPYGVFGYIDEAGALVVPSMTRHIWDKCEVPDKTFTFPRDKWGDSSWPRAIREKKANYTNKESVKTPEGHIGIRRHISLPILFRDEVIGLLQVANKETDYKEADFHSLETISGIIAPVLDARLKRARQEEALRRSEERFRIAAGSVSDCVWEWDIAKDTLDWFGDIDRILGYGKDEFPRTIDAWEKAIHPDDRKRIMAALDRHLLTKESYSEEYRVIRKDGSIAYWMDKGTASWDESDKAYVMIGAITDITVRKRAEEVLRESEARYKTLVENIPQKIVMKDRKYRWVSINENFARDLGVRPKDVVGKVDHDLFPKEFADKYRADDVRIMETGKTEEIEEKYLQEGRETWVNTIKTPVRDEYGEIVGVFVIFWDITKRKKAEEALKESERRFRALFDNTPDGIVLANPENKKFTIGNETFYQMLGYNSDEIQNLGVMDIHPAEEVNHSADQFEKLLRKEIAVAENIPVKRKDGSIFFADIRAFLVSLAGKTYLTGIFRDITERRRAEDALKISKDRLLFATEGANLGVWNWNTVTGELIWSDKCKALFGIRPDETMSYQRFSDALHPDDRERTDKAVQDALDNHTDYDIEYRSLWPDGSIHWLAAKGRGYYDATGKAVRLEGVVVDVAARKRDEEALKQTAADLERSNKELEQFAYVASHDLQEPLRMVSSYTQLLAQRYEGQLDDKAKKYIDYAVDGAVRLQRLINDLLTYSRVGTRGKPLEPTDSHSVLGEVLLNLQFAVEENRAIVTNDDLPTVRADASQLVQIFQNLIANAIKFRGESPPRIHVSARDRGREWLFSISDNGIGIDPQYKDRLFMIFQRLHTKQEYPGTGIGLALCKRIVERHGGKIWFESEPGKGSTFFFSIPK